MTDEKFLMAVNTHRNTNIFFFEGLMNEDTIITSRYVHPLLETELCVIRDVLLCCIRMQVGKTVKQNLKTSNHEMSSI